MSDTSCTLLKLMKLPVLLAVVAVAVLAGCAGLQDPMRTPPRKAEYRSAYNRPLMSPGAQFGTLPSAVQNTIRAEAGSAPIADVVKDTASGQVVYKIYFRYRDLFPPLYIAPDGSVLNPDLTVAVAAPRESIPVPSGSSTTPVKLGDLPPKVVKAIQERAPRALLGAIDAEPWGERMVYIISFKDPLQHPKLYVAADGTVLKDGQK